MIGTFFKLVGKAFRFSVVRPLLRFNVYNRAKKYLGEDAKYFMPAPRAIGALTKNSSSQYPHLIGSSGFKSVQERRLEAIERRNRRLLEEDKSDGTGTLTTNIRPVDKSYSETIKDDKIVIETSNKLPVIKTTTIINRPCEKNSDVDKPHRPLPTSTNLQLSDPAVIWQVSRVPPGRLDLEKFQELMINKLADESHWTPKQISETYNIKEEYAENIITYFKQIKIILSPRIAHKLDYVARNDPLYQSYKDTIYYVDYNLRDDIDRLFDETFLPTDELDPEVRKVLDGGGKKLQKSPDRQVTGLFKRPAPLRLAPINVHKESSQRDDRQSINRKLLASEDIDRTLEDKTENNSKKR